MIIYYLTKLIKVFILGTMKIMRECTFKTYLIIQISKIHIRVEDASNEITMVNYA